MICVSLSLIDLNVFVFFHEFADFFEERVFGKFEQRFLLPALAKSFRIDQVRELQRLLGKKTLEAEILKEALEHAAGTKKRLRLPPLPPKDGSR